MENSKLLEYIKNEMFEEERQTKNETRMSICLMNRWGLKLLWRRFFSHSQLNIWFKWKFSLFILWNFFFPAVNLLFLCEWLWRHFTMMMMYVIERCDVWVFLNFRFYERTFLNNERRLWCYLINDGFNLIETTLWIWNFMHFLHFLNFLSRYSYFCGCNKLKNIHISFHILCRMSFDILNHERMNFTIKYENFCTIIFHPTNMNTNKFRKSLEFSTLKLFLNWN